MNMVNHINFEQPRFRIGCICKHFVVFEHLIGRTYNKFNYNGDIIESIYIHPNGRLNVFIKHKSTYRLGE